MSGSIHYSIEVETKGRGWIEIPGYVFQGGGDPYQLASLAAQMNASGAIAQLVRETRTREVISITDRIEKGRDTVLKENPAHA